MAEQSHYEAGLDLLRQEYEAAMSQALADHSSTPALYLERVYQLTKWYRQERAKEMAAIRAQGTYRELSHS